MTDWWDRYFEIVIDYRDAFQEFEFDIFLDYGTLLGYVREGDFIKADDDVDLGMIGKWNFPEWEDVQIKLKEKRFNSNVKIREFQYQSYREEFGIDIFIREERDGYLCLDDTDVYWPKIPREVFLPLQSIKWRGESFLIPNMPKLYLTYLYGKYWEFPICMGETSCRERINDDLSTEPREQGRELYNYTERILDNPWNIIQMNSEKRKIRDKMRNMK